MVRKRTEIDWTDHHIARFWEWYGSSSIRDSSYFTAHVGKGIVRFIAESGILEGRVLDYGCGKGHLLNELLRWNLECFGAELSPKATQDVNSAFQKNENWHGCRLIDGFTTDYPSDYFNLVTLIETIEHLPKIAVEPTICELRRVTKPDGFIVITTPYAEDLERSMVFCPFCGSEYHPMQHIQSFSKESIREDVSVTGLEIVFCDNLDFSQWQHEYRLPQLAHINLKSLQHWTAFHVLGLVDRIFPRPFPHGRKLNWIGQKGHVNHLCVVAKKTGEA